MNSSVVTIRVNGQPYQLGCDPGQEAEIEALGRMVDETVSSLSSSVGKIGESRLLVMAAILLAEQAKAAGASSASVAEQAAPSAQADSESDIISDKDMGRLENIAKQISALAATLK